MLWQKSELNITVIDTQSEKRLSDPEMDGREIAMNHMSKAILEEMGVLQRFDTGHIHRLNDAKVVNGNPPTVLQFVALRSK